VQIYTNGFLFSITVTITLAAQKTISAAHEAANAIAPA
jgi:hypothetical protein